MLPRVIYHVAASVDGRTVGFEPDVGLFYKLAATWREDCTLTGADTILAALFDDSSGEDEGKAPVGEDTRPLLAVVDSRGRVKNWESLTSAPYWNRYASLGSASTPADHIRHLERLGVEVISAGESRVDLRTALVEIKTRFGVETVRVDSGGVLAGALLREGLVDEVSVLVHPTLVGGTSPRLLYNTPGEDYVGRAAPMEFISAEAVTDGIVWLRYTIDKGTPGKTKE